MITCLNKSLGSSGPTFDNGSILKTNGVKYRDIDVVIGDAVHLVRKSNNVSISLYFYWFECSNNIVLTNFCRSFLYWKDYNKNAIKVVTLQNKHVGWIDQFQAQQISPVMDMENKRLSSQALVLVPLCRIVDKIDDYMYRLEIMGKDNCQLLSQKAQLSSSHIGNNWLSVVASSSKPKNAVLPVMEEASTGLRCQKLVGHIISVTKTKSKEWTNQEMSQLEISRGWGIDSDEEEQLDVIFYLTY